MFADVETVHVESTSRCNSRCPMCSRYTAKGHIQPELKRADLSLEIFLKLFSDSFTRKLKHVYFSGVYGDPCLNPSLINFIEHLKKYDVSVNVDSNAGMQNEDWWSRLAQTHARVNFAIDGLQDTNHVYRRHVVWEKVWSNLNRFVQSGGRGSWTFIVFKHNQHQVEEARSLAKNLGLDFRVKVTQKFRGYRNWSVMEHGEKLYDIEPPTIPIYRHENVGEAVHHVKGDFFNFPSLQEPWPEMDTVSIDCRSLRKRELYLSYSGHLLPCCFLGTLHHDSPGSVQFRQWFDLDKVDLHKIGVDAALQNLALIEGTWRQKSIRDGKLLTCARTCGVHMKNVVEYVG